MAEILGVGCTHRPLMLRPNEDWTFMMRAALDDPAMPAEMKNPANWPEPLREELGNDWGTSSAARGREVYRAHFAEARRAIDEFEPDLIVMWGDDQYENFKEDIIPPFCVMAYEAFELKPWEEYRGTNVWDEPKDKTFAYQGHPAAAKFLTNGLLEAGFDLSYAYRPLHHHLGHAFLNTLLYLDYDRQGFTYPVVPFQVNCYGRRVISQRGGAVGWGHLPTDEDLDPPSPAPWRCFDLGAATARVLAASPWKVALIASSSWSHAFLTPKHHLLYPDVEADRALYEALRAGDYQKWRETPLSAIEESGQQEMLNWMCLAGAMAELGRKPTETELIQTYIFNSSKCFAYFMP